MMTLEITIQRKTDGAWPVVSSFFHDGLTARNEASLRLDQTALLGEMLDPRAYGRRLGQSVFTGTVRDGYIGARQQAGDRLHVLLNVEATELQSIHWERMCGPPTWDYLGLDQKTPFSQYLPSSTDRRFRSFTPRELRALVVVASPTSLADYQLEPFDVAAAILAARTSLGEIPCDVLAHGVDGAIGPPTLDAICERITARRYPLLHVVCHGRRTETETVLYLATSNRGVDPVTDSRWVERLGRLEGPTGLPHFAFLAACESASQSGREAMSGLAQRMVRDVQLGMPAVLAMTDPVSVETATLLVGQYYKHLQSHGEPDLALCQACAGLADRPDVIVPALYSRLGGRPLFVDTPDRPLSPEETRFGLDRIDTELQVRAPCLLSDFAKLKNTLSGLSGVEYKQLAAAAQRDHDAAMRKVDALCLEIFEVPFIQVAVGKNLIAYDHRCPFRGLYPFRIADQEFFFGRDRLIDDVASRLADEQFLAVVGPSGSGKSSLVLAGLVPKLQLIHAGLKHDYMTPGENPIEMIDIVLGRSPGLDLLVVDQFEELFTLCRQPADRLAFANRLIDLTREIRVVVTLRADFWGECTQIGPLKDLIVRRQELVGPMSVAELRSAIDQQAHAVRLEFEGGLSGLIVDKVVGEPGAMPLLQHALLELWKRRRGRWLTMKKPGLSDVPQYEDADWALRAIGDTAEAVYRDLSATNQERVRDIMVRLARLGDDRNGEVRRDTRQRVRLAELIPHGADPEATKRLVKMLADEGARLLVVAGDLQSQEGATVEIAHEALLRYWNRLRRWLDEDRVDLRILASVREAAVEWSKSRADDGVLVHRGARLADAERLRTHPRLDLNREETEYLSACAELRDRERRTKEEQSQRELRQAQVLAESQKGKLTILRRSMAAVSGLLLVAISLGLLSFFSYRAEQKSKENAESALGEKKTALEKAEIALSERKIALESAEAINKAQTKILEIIDEEQSSRPEFQQIAIKLFKSVLESLEAELKANPGDPILRRKLSEKFIGLAWNLHNMDQLDEALSTYRHSAELIADLSQKSPGDLKLALRHAFVLNNIGWVHSTRKATAEAEKSYRASLEISEKLLADHPNDLAFIRQVSVTYANLGAEYSDRKDEKTAIEYHFRALKGNEFLSEKEPEVLWRFHNLSGTVNNLSNSHRAIGDIKNAIAFKERAYDIRKSTLKRRRERPETPEEIALTVYVLSFGEICVTYAELLAETEGDLKRSQHLVDEGLPLLEELSTKSPNNKNYAKKYVMGLRIAADVAKRSLRASATVDYLDRAHRAAETSKLGPNVLEGIGRDHVMMGQYFQKLRDMPSASSRYLKGLSILGADANTEKSSPESRQLILQSLEGLTEAGPGAISDASDQLKKFADRWKDPDLRKRANELHRKWTSK